MLSEQMKSDGRLKSAHAALPGLNAARPDLASDYLAPRNDLERKLVKAWEETLGIEPIGVRDDFFELGGHSQAATDLFAQIEQAVGASLPLVTLLRAPTVEKLARVVRRGHKAIADEALVPIQPNGTRLPFFCVIPPGGDAVEMVQLANLLGQEQPFYGLQRHRLHVQDQQATTDPNNSTNPYIAARRFRQAGWQEDESLGNVSGVERMAAYYLRIMRDVQPRGPYTLGGRCFGGLVAIEMGHQLLAQGEQIALLALFGTTPPGYHAPTKHMLDRLAFHSKRGRLLSVLFSYAKIKLARIPRDLRRRKYTRANERALKKAARSPDDDQQAASAHMARYEPHVYAGRLTIFDTTRDTHDLWAEWAEQGVDYHVISGTHHDVFYEPGVHEFARQLSACLEQAQQKAMAVL